MKLLVITLLTLSSKVLSVLGSCSSENSITISGNDIMWPHDVSPNDYTRSGRYEPNNIIPSKMQVHGDIGIILTLPRIKPGVPFTLGLISVDQISRGKILMEPLITLSQQREGECDAIQNAVDLALKGNILWVLDTGIVNVLTQPVRRCDPKVFIIDLEEEKIIETINLTPFTSTDSTLQSIAVENDNGHFYVYVSDAYMMNIIVYDVQNQRGIAAAIPPEVSLSDTYDDILYMAFIPDARNPKLFITYGKSSRIFSIETNKLKQIPELVTLNYEGSKMKKIAFIGAYRDHIFIRQLDPFNHMSTYHWDTKKNFGNHEIDLINEGNDCRIPTATVFINRNLFVLESNIHHYVNNSLPVTGPSIAIVRNVL